MTLQKLEQKYLNGELSKSDFISDMYAQNHKALFDYSKFIKNRDIKKIEINDGLVTMTSRELGIKIAVVSLMKELHQLKFLILRTMKKQTLI